MKIKILIPIFILAAVGFGVWWYVTDVLPERNAEEDTSGTPAPGEEDVDETTVIDGVVEVTVEGDEYSFSPATITVAAGKTVKLIFKNVGNNIHTWTIDDLNASTGSVFPGSSKTVEFDAVPAGTYEIYCSVAGHKELGMVGTLKVE